MTRLYEVAKCQHCPNLQTSHTRGAGMWAEDWMCGASNGRLVAGYIEGPSDHPKQIPEWCPLPKMEESPGQAGAEVNL